MAISVLFTAAFAGISIVWDREFGFLREMLVAPVSTASILIGKALGGATVATLQCFVLLALAGLVGVPYDPLMLLAMVGLIFLMGFMITSLGLLLAARVKQIQTAMPLVQLVITPLMFLSGALFPLSGLPTWLAVLTHINPMTYAVEPLRSVVFDHLDVDAATRARFDPGIVWGSWTVPVGVQILMTDRVLRPAAVPGGVAVPADGVRLRPRGRGGARAGRSPAPRAARGGSSTASRPSCGRPGRR